MPSPAVFAAGCVAVACVAVACLASPAAAAHVGVLRKAPNMTAAGLCDSTVTQEAGYYELPEAGGGSAKKSYFYWFFESRGKPSTDPLIIWMTGGPGCSSMLALLAENGPCKVNADGATTSNNPNSWTTNANVLWIDQPAGVGFSYADQAGYDDDEAEVSADMWNFVQALLQDRTSLQKNPLFVFGESYGGHYAPATAHRILANNENLGAGEVKVPLAGLGVGNGLTQPIIQYDYYAELAYNYSITKLGHAVITEATYSQMRQEWPQCKQDISECQQQTGDCGEAQSFCNNAMLGPYQQTGMNPYDIRKQCGSNPLCYDFSTENSYLNDATVQKALGVDRQWQSCNFQVNSMFSDDWAKDFDQDVSALLEAGLKVLIYAGDCDFVCNWLGNQAWTLALDWSGKSAFNAAKMTPWSVSSAPAGEYRTAAGSTGGSSFTFLRVFNAGHMVPMDQPENALAMVNKFLHSSF